MQKAPNQAYGKMAAKFLSLAECHRLAGSLRAEPVWLLCKIILDSISSERVAGCAWLSPCWFSDQRLMKTLGLLSTPDFALQLLLEWERGQLLGCPRLYLQSWPGPCGDLLLLTGRILGAS